jgi:hypothetical protein
METVMTHNDRRKYRAVRNAAKARRTLHDTTTYNCLEMSTSFNDIASDHISVILGTRRCCLMKVLWNIRLRYSIQEFQ